MKMKTTGETWETSSRATKGWSCEVLNTLRGSLRIRQQLPIEARFGKSSCSGFRTALPKCSSSRTGWGGLRSRNDNKEKRQHKEADADRQGLSEVSGVVTYEDVLSCRQNC